MPRRASVLMLTSAASQLALYEVAPGGSASVRYVQLLQEDAAPTAFELEDALPLTALLAPIGEAKDAIVAALEALQAEPFEAADKAGKDAAALVPWCV